MATRKVKDAKDLKTNELIYFRGHAQATYMSDGRTVEDAIDDVKEVRGRVVFLTQAEYDALGVYDNEVLYVIVE